MAQKLPDHQDIQTPKRIEPCPSACDIPTKTILVLAMSVLASCKAATPNPSIPVVDIGSTGQNITMIDTTPNSSNPSYPNKALMKAYIDRVWLYFFDLYQIHHDTFFDQDVDGVLEETLRTEIATQIDQFQNSDQLTSTDLKRIAAEVYGKIAFKPTLIFKNK